MAVTLGLPVAASIRLWWLAIRFAAKGTPGAWVGYTGWLSLLNLFVVPMWWSLCLISKKSGAGLDLVRTAPMAALLLVPLPVSILVSRFINYQSDALIFSKRWRSGDILRLALWRTVSSTFALLAVAMAIDDIYSSNVVGLVWLFVAGCAALIGAVKLRAAEGVSPRPVKSGELYKRASLISKKMGVHLTRVSVVPFGRGRLTNAYGGLTQISVTDDYGHWLHGSELDFVIAHELAHIKNRDAVKTIATVGGMFVAIAAATYVMQRSRCLRG
jgi:Zn-dependent protease with chaperone function